MAITACSDTGSTESISAEQLSDRVKAGEELFILDVRSPEEFATGHIPGAVNVSVNDLGAQLDKMPADKTDEVIVYCHSGKRAGVAEALLSAEGFSNMKDLAGHYQGWSSDQLPLE